LATFFLFSSEVSIYPSATVFDFHPPCRFIVKRSAPVSAINDIDDRLKQCLYILQDLINLGITRSFLAYHQRCLYQQAVLYKTLFYILRKIDRDRCVGDVISDICELFRPCYFFQCRHTLRKIPVIFWFSCWKFVQGKPVLHP
jgi:NAD-dependent dihydropyrimidine dehydrogenase PreA subunit